MVDITNLMVVPLSGAVVVTKQAVQMPTTIVLADVTGGTLTIEVSTDNFVADTRRIHKMTAGASPSVQQWVSYQAKKNEYMRFTLTAGDAHVRLEPTTLT